MDKLRVNKEIKGLKTIRLVGENREPKVMLFSEAIKIANEIGLDLVEINGKLDIPVIKLMDYEKYLYEKKKSDKKNKKNVTTLKEIKIGVCISENDLQTKTNHIIAFLKKGNKVKITQQMKGRQNVFKTIHKANFLEFIISLEDYGTPESMLTEDNNKFTIILKPKK